MTESTPRIVNCPTCSNAVKWTLGNAYRPFCSERCKLIDFGAWIDEQHSIAGDSLDSVSDDDELLSGAQSDEC